MRSEILTEMYNLSNLIDEYVEDLDKLEDLIVKLERKLPHKLVTIRVAFNTLYPNKVYKKDTSKKAEKLLEKMKEENANWRSTKPELLTYLDYRSELIKKLSKARRRHSVLEEKLVEFDDSEIAYIPESEEKPVQMNYTICVSVDDKISDSAENQCSICKLNRMCIKSKKCKHLVTCYSCMEKCKKCPT